MLSAIANYNSGVFKSIRAAAAAYGVPRTTLRTRLNGGQTHAQGAEHLQSLSPSQETFLVEWILEEDARGFPPSHQRAREMAERISIVNGNKNSGRALGNHWLQSFIRRNPEIGSRIGKKIEGQRTQHTTEKEILEFLAHYEAIRSKYSIRLDNEFNMDEQGLGLGICSNQYVLTSSKKKKTLLKTPETREWVSVIETISATGRKLNPLVIFKGQSLQTDWFTSQNVPDWQYTTSPNGWTTDKIAIGWLEHVFNPQTYPAGGGWRLLLLDGHGSHVSLEFLYLCKMVYNIALVFMPPHSSHILQPLDLAAFSPTKRLYRSHINELSQIDDAAPVKKARFLICYYKARLEGLNTSNIEAGWMAAGIYPWNPSKPLSSPYVLPLPPTQPLLGPTATPTRKRPRALSFKTPTKEQDLIAVRRSLWKLPQSTKNIITKSGKALGGANSTVATLLVINKKLQARLQEVEIQPRKKAIRIDPNERFASIKTIQKQVDQAATEKASLAARAKAKTPKTTPIKAPDLAFGSMCSIISF